MNQLTIIGYLGNDAKLENFNGQTIINFSVAVSDAKKVNGEWKNETIWYRCSYFTEHLKVENFTKGIQVVVTGTPRIKTYQDSSGNTQLFLSVSVNYVQRLTKFEPKAPKQTAIANQLEPINDDLPF